MPEHRDQVDALASIMEEFHLKEAALTVAGLHISFKRTYESAPTADVDVVVLAPAHPTEAKPKTSKPVGAPVTSPMNGIFYDAPSPSSGPFVREGDIVTAGQVIGLIEAMKVFNEIPCPVAGTVLSLVAEPGSVVQPGDVLLYVG